MEDGTRYRTFWPRLCSGFIDGFLFSPLAWIDQWIWSVVTARPLLVLWFVVASLAYLVYEVLLHGFFGQTLGKRVMKVRVFDVSGQPLSMRQALLRSSVPLVFALIGLVSDLPSVASGRNPAAVTSFSDFSVLQLLSLWASLAWFILEVVTMLLNSNRRALHDFIASSVVMRVGAR